MEEIVRVVSLTGMELATLLYFTHEWLPEDNIDRELKKSLMEKLGIK